MTTITTTDAEALARSRRADAAEVVKVFNAAHDALAKMAAIHADDLNGMTDAEAIAYVRGLDGAYDGLRRAGWAIIAKPFAEFGLSAGLIATIVGVSEAGVRTVLNPSVFDGLLPAYTIGKDGRRRTRHFDVQAISEALQKYLHAEVKRVAADGADVDAPKRFVLLMKACVAMHLYATMTDPDATDRAERLREDYETFDSMAQKFGRAASLDIAEDFVEKFYGFERGQRYSVYYTPENVRLAWGWTGDLDGLTDEEREAKRLAEWDRSIEDGATPDGLRKTYHAIVRDKANDERDRGHAFWMLKTAEAAGRI